MSSNSEYPKISYPPLQASDIRFLELEPMLNGFEAEGLRGRLVHRNFSPPNSVPEYESLSYVWGDQSNPDSITNTTAAANKDSDTGRNIGVLSIGRNLGSALYRLRLERDFFCLKSSVRLVEWPGYA